MQYTMAIQHCPIPKEEEKEKERGKDDEDENADGNDDDPNGNGNDDGNSNEEEKEDGIDHEQNAILKQHLCVFHGNRGACHIAMEEWEAAVEECTESIGYNKEYLK